MKRDFYKVLLWWKDHPLRKPLIVRGSRQVGKTYSIESFGKEHFKNVVTINFELSPSFQQCFESLEPSSILQQLELLIRQKITIGETLLFFDEIQMCPRALQSLRFFYEKMPELHLIAAGSLLEFSIREEDFSFPVGRVQFAKLYPLSFAEFLDANKEHALKEALESYNLTNPPPPAIHDELLKKVREYFIVGGMPAAITAYLKTKSFLEAKFVQNSLWDAFEADFSKYAKQTKHRYLKIVFQEGPKMIGKHVKYSRFDPDLPNPSREMKEALELLRLAGLVHPIFSTSAAGTPLIAGIKTNIFKLLFLDIGLVEQNLNVDPNYAGLLEGGLAEQFVGQELLSYSDPLLDQKIFFWVREGQNAAEVDYLITHKNIVFPIEVKAGKIGKLKSLYVYTEEKKVPFGIKISQDALSFEKKVLSVPFYMVSHLPRLIDEATHRSQKDLT